MQRTSTAAGPSGERLDATAAALVAAYHERRCIEAPSRAIPNLTKAGALEIGERVRALRIAAGAVPAGYKVGFTNARVRDQFDAEARMAATVYRDTLAPAPRIAAAPLLGPRIEPEIVVGIGDDGEPAWAALGFEIVQSHVAEWKFTYLDAIADFGLHAALVIGERRVFDAAGVDRLAALRVELRRGDDVTETGAAGDVDDGPLGSIAFLRDDLRRVGRALQPGDVVSTGSMTRVPAIAAGERWTIAALGDELPALTLDVV